MDRHPEAIRRGRHFGQAGLEFLSCRRVPSRETLAGQFPGGTKSRVLITACLDPQPLRSWGSFSRSDRPDLRSR